MITWIIKYWLEVLFGIITGLFAFVIKKLSARVKKEHELNEAIVIGLQALLRTQLTEICEKYTKAKYCPIHVKENVDDLYKAYHAIGGNGAGTAAYNHVMALPEIPPSNDCMKASSDFINIT
jgi:hypothetical protein